jgi:TIR domain
MRRPKRLPREIFISHAHQDRAFVSKLTRILRRHKINFWYSPKHIIGGQQWHDEIGKALACCDWFLIVLSPSAVRSEWVGYECVYALNDNRYKGKIVPLLYRTCCWKKLSWTLRGFQWVSFKKDYQVLEDELLKIWGFRVRRIAQLSPVLLFQNLFVKPPVLQRQRRQHQQVQYSRSHKAA